MSTDISHNKISVKSFSPLIFRTISEKGQSVNKKKGYSVTITTFFAKSSDLHSPNCKLSQNEICRQNGLRSSPKSYLLYYLIFYRICSFLLSSQNIFILLKEKVPKVQFTLLATYPLSEVKFVTIGLFGQWIRMKAGNTSYVLISRNHHESHEFIHNFRESLLLENPVAPPTITHTNELTLRNISFQFCDNVPCNDIIEFYMMAYLCVKGSAYSACFTRRSMKATSFSLTPVSLLILQFPDKIVLYLCREDYGNQPKDFDCTESDNNFPIIAEQLVDGLLGIVRIFSYSFIIL